MKAMYRVEGMRVVEGSIAVGKSEPYRSMMLSLSAAMRHAKVFSEMREFSILRVVEYKPCGSVSLYARI